MAASEQQDKPVRAPIYTKDGLYGYVTVPLPYRSIKEWYDAESLWPERDPDTGEWVWRPKEK